MFKGTTSRRLTNLAGAIALGAAAIAGPLTQSASADSPDVFASRAIAGCSFVASYDIYADPPRLEWPNVWMTGGIDWIGAPYCFPDSSGVYAQTKACGVFGCNWQTKGSVEYTPWNGMRETPGMTCRKGTHRYRTRTVLGYRVLGQFGTQPGEPKIWDSNIQPEFSCK